MHAPEILPFRALRFSPKAGDPGALIAPPYDVINAVQQQSLLAASPHNVVRIERPDDGDDGDRYKRAAATLAAWRQAGLLTRDAAPAIYLHEHGFEVRGTRHQRTGFYARVRIEPHKGGAVRPHESVLEAPLADRVEMLRGLRTQVSPVFAMYPSDRPLPIPDVPPDLDFAVGGETHRLWILSDPGDVSRVMAAVKGPLYIADGHHRYAAGRAYRDERRAKSPSWIGHEPEDYVVMALVPTHNLLVLATHRLVRTRCDGASTKELLGRLEPWFRIAMVPIAELEAKVAEAGQRGTAFGLAGLEPDQALVLTAKKDAIASAMPSDRSAPWRELDVAILGEIVLTRVLGIDTAAVRSGAIAYTPDASEALTALRERRAELALILNPTKVEQVLAVADAEDDMPQKSTYFYPKLPTGLVLHPFD